MATAEEDVAVVLRALKDETTSVSVADYKRMEQFYKSKFQDLNSALDKLEAEQKRTDELIADLQNTLARLGIETTTSELTNTPKETAKTDIERKFNTFTRNKGNLDNAAP
jgi:predicted  nucleic acid-binding Zn-ribbon protein